MQCIANPRDLHAALVPTGTYWRELSSRFQDLDQTVLQIVSTPLFQHTYGTAYGSPTKEEMLLDARSATSLLANNVFSFTEIQVFGELGLVSHMSHGLALAARHLRARASTIPPQQFVQTVRMRAFTYILKLIGEDLANPRPTLEKVVRGLDINEAERMSLLQASLANVINQSSKLVLH